MMKKITATALLFAGLLLGSCERKTAVDAGKGVQVSTIATDAQGNPIEGLSASSPQCETEVSRVLATEHLQYRLVPLFKVNTNNYGERYLGSVNFYEEYTSYTHLNNGNNWNGNIVAGFKTMNGSEMVNVSLFNANTQESALLFEKTVLIENVYYPTPMRDTLAYKPVSRNCYMVSCYDEDTDKDGLLTRTDLRRFYLFSLEGNKVKSIIPKEYGVVGSDYDEANDALNVYARLDSNKNGKIEANEPKHIFFINLKKPENTVPLYK